LSLWVEVPEHGLTRNQASKMIEELQLKKGAAVVEKVPRQRF
jgi:hypothetical protein